MPDSLPRRVVLEVQEGGAGASAWKTLDLANDITMVRIGANSGGDIEFVDEYGRNQAKGGQLEIVGTRQTGTPSPITFDLEVGYKVRATLRALDGKKNLRARYFSGEYSVATNFNKIQLFCNSRNTNKFGTVNRDLVNDFEDVGDQLKRLFPQRASHYEELDELTRQKISATVTTLGISHVISVGYPRAAGDIPGESENNPGNKEYLIVTLKDVSNLPHIFWTSNKGSAWVDNTGTGLTNFDGTAIARAGANVIISGSGAGGGLAYANFEAVKAGTATWTRSTNISAGTVVNFVVAVDALTLYACGNAGAVYKSTDGGMSFSSLGTAVTANNLSRIAVSDNELLWIGGASGTLVRVYKDVMSLVTVGALAAAINSLAVPPGGQRGRQLYVGAADGKIYRTYDGLATTPAFTTPSFDSSGSGAIDGLAFAGYEGAVLYIAQTNGSTQSRILRDLSGGFLGQDVQILGSFAAPANSSINALAAADINTVMAVGDVNGGQGYIELVS